MLIEGPDSLRVVDPAGEREAGSFERGWAIVLLILAACDVMAIVVVFGQPLIGRAPLGIPLEVDRFFGVMGAIFVPVWIAGAVWLIREYRRRRAAWTYDYAALIAWPDDVEGGDGDALAYESLDSITVRWRGADRTITLHTRGGKQIQCALGAYADDAEFARVLEVLEQRVTRFGVHVDRSEPH